MSNRFSKPVAFNKTKEDDQKILKHVSRKNFSGYVKKLILADMSKEEKGPFPVKEKKPIKLSVSDRLAAAKQTQPKIFRPNGGVNNG